MTPSWQGGEGPVTADKHVFCLIGGYILSFFNFFYDLKEHLGKKESLTKVLLIFLEL